MANPELVAHNQQFEKKIFEHAEGLWTAVGYAASNVHMVEGKDTVTIIDTTESTKAAENISAEFRKLCDKPVGRIIYTHSHRDHISGATIFAKQAEGDLPILASRNFQSDLVGLDENRIAPDKALGQRTMAQFGIGLNGEQRINLGCGPGDRPMEGLGAGYLPPTELIEGDCDIDLDGVAARLLMMPGETPDHMVVWLPQQNVLFCGDNWYHSFPNLYAIRGTAYRDYEAWAQTLGRLAALKPLVLAPGHTNPVYGADQVEDGLISTRDAILHVMRFTADAMDQGMAVNDIAASIELPPELADRPWLKEFYGKLGWSARAYAAGTLGWYDGNATHLGTLSTQARAAELAALAGGADKLTIAAEQTRNLQWRLELCDHLTALGRDVRSLKAGALEKLAEDEINATARNTYLWQAMKLRQAIAAG